MQFLNLSGFLLFFNNKILALISHCKNIFIHPIQQNFSRQRKANETREELQILTGLLLLLGMTELRNLSTVKAGKR
jgi:hypothetical protein